MVFTMTWVSWRPTPLWLQNMSSGSKSLHHSIRNIYWLVSCRIPRSWMIIKSLCIKGSRIPLRSSTNQGFDHSSHGLSDACDDRMGGGRSRKHIGIPPASIWHSVHNSNFEIPTDPLVNSHSWKISPSSVGTSALHGPLSNSMA